MSALAVATGAINLGQGFPDYRRSAVRCSTPRSTRSGPGRTSTRRAGPAGAAARDRRPPTQRFYGLEHDPGSRGARDRRCHRGAGGRTARDARHRRRGRGVRADVRQLPGVHRARRCRRQAGRVAARDVGPTASTTSTPTNSAPRSHLARTKLVLVNTPHNPTGKVFTRSELTFIGDLAIDTTRSSSPTRSTSTSSSPAPTHVPMATHALTTPIAP